MSSKSDIISKFIIQLRRAGVVPAAGRLSALEAWVANFDPRLTGIEARLERLEGGGE